jgi:transposase
MINVAAETKILICNQTVDMRKSIDGLVTIVVQNLELDPQSKALYLFSNKSGDKVKGIVWEGDGFMLLYKRLETKRFKFPKNIEDASYTIDADLFNWLRKGFDFYALKQCPELKISSYY